MNPLSGFTNWLGGLLHVPQSRPQPRPQPKPVPNLQQFLAQHLGGVGPAIHNVTGPVAQAITHIPDIHLQGLEQLTGNHNITVGKAVNHTPVLGTVVQGAENVARQTAAGHAPSVGQFAGQVAQTGVKAGTQLAGYLSPELKILKAGVESPLIAKLGARFVNQAVPAAGISAAGDVISGNRDIKSIAGNALLNGATAGTLNAAPTLVRAAAPGVKVAGQEAGRVLANESGHIMVPTGKGGAHMDNPDMPPTAKVKGAATTPAVLPKELAGAKLNYNSGDKSFNLNFGDDVTKALYIVGGKGKSASHDAYAQFLQKATGKTDAQISSMAQDVRDNIKAQSKTTEPGTLQVPSHPDVLPPAQLTAKVPTKRGGLGGLVDPTTGKVDTNQTPPRILADPTVPQASKDAITNFTHLTHDDKLMTKSATNLVRKDANTARGLFDDNHLVASGNLDAHIHLGNSLVDHYNQLGNTAEAGKVYDHLIQATTQYGQGLRAIQSISKISPQGIVSFAQNMAKARGRNITPELEAELKSTAKTVAQMPEGPEKAAAIKEMINMAKQPSAWDKTKSFGAGVLSIPRALMATGDLSFALRQGAVLGTRFPKEWASANANAAKYAFNPKAFEKGMSDLANMTDKNGEALAPTFKAMGLDMPALFGKAEEQYGDTHIIEGETAKKLGIGHVVAGSERAFSGAAAEFRGDVAAKIINGYGGVKGLSDWTTKDLKDLGRVLNTATGRGQGAKDGLFEKAAPFFSKTLFSARLWKSKLDMLNPVYYATLSPAARKIALQSSGSFATVVGATLAAAAAAGASVETDPRSSDFGKIKVGNTRYDIMGGLQQNIVLAAREIMNAKKDSTTGVIKPFDGGYGHPTRLSAATDLLTNKETPVLATISHWMAGKDIGGQPFNPWTAIASLFIPLGAQDVYGVAKDTGDPNPVTATLKGVAKAAPSFAGIGVQTYGGTPATPANTAEAAGTITSTSAPSPTKAAPDTGLIDDNTTPAYKAAQKAAKTQKAAALADGTRLGGSTELDAAQSRIDTATKNLPTGISKASSDVLVRYAKLNDNGKAAFNADPANEYKLAQAKYESDKLNGKLDTLQDFTRQQSLGKQGVTSQYSHEAQTLYSMSKVNRNAFLEANPDYAKFMPEMEQLDAQLAAKGWISKAKFGTSTSSSKAYAKLQGRLNSRKTTFRAVSIKGFKVKRARIKT